MSLGSALRSGYRFLRDPWHWDPRAVASRRMLEDLKDKHAGEDMAIFATGPSLLNTDVSPYDGMKKIGLNRIYLHTAQTGMKIDYIIVANDLLSSQFYKEFQDHDSMKVLPWASRKYFKVGDDACFLNYADDKQFVSDMTGRVSVGATVTFPALQLAYWLGARNVYMLGLDHYYSYQPHEVGMEPHQVSERTDPDQNHVHPDYFGAGIKWQLPDLLASEEAYAIAREFYERDGRRIINATPGSKLEIFEKIGA